MSRRVPGPGARWAGAGAALLLLLAGLAILLAGYGTGMRLTPCWGGCRSGGELGTVLTALTPEQLSIVESGRWWFGHAHTLREGLGPFFNAQSCLECHDTALEQGAPRSVPGGAGRDNQVGPFHTQALYAGRTDPDGTFDGLIREGGEVRHQRTIQDLVPGCVLPPQTVPPDAPFVSPRQAPPLFGLGLIDAIPDEAILAQERAAKPDGVRGRANLGPAMDPFVNDHVVGRFGWKAEYTSVLQAVADQYFVHLGMTSPYEPMEITTPRYWVPNAPAPQISELPEPCRQALAWPYEANAKGEVVLALAEFVRALRPADPTPSPAAERGRQVFAETGCAVCHLPSYTTGPDPDAALANQPVPLYSDLLVHDLGPANADGIVAGLAHGSDWRTTPLWGLSHRPYLWHDGRFSAGRDGILGAIRAHGDEAAVAVERFAALDAADRDDLLAFLLAL